MTGLEVQVWHLLVAFLGSIGGFLLLTWKTIVKPFTDWKVSQEKWKTGVERDLDHLKTKVGSQMDEIREELKGIRSCQAELKQAIATLSERSKHN